MEEMRQLIEKRAGARAASPANVFQSASSSQGGDFERIKTLASEADQDIKRVVNNYTAMHEELTLFVAEGRDVSMTAPFV